MLKIYICEDGKEQRESIQRIIDCAVFIENYDMEISLVAEKPQQILDKIVNTEGTGIYFLDVDLNDDINGIELAQKIRQHDPNGFIIFVTTHGELSYLTFTYKVEALDYIIKGNYDNVKEKVCDCLRNINSKYYGINNEEFFSIKLDDKIINIEYKKILFFETSNNIHKVVVYTSNRSVEFYGKLKDIEKKLKNNGFIRCHTSYVVNKSNIKEIDKKERVAHMVDGSTCLISVRGMKLLV